MPWAAHSYIIAFSDEIGHFEYCNAVVQFGNRTQAGGNDAALDGDDVFCFPASASLLVQISGCLGGDDDFDGVPYQNTGPGSFTNKGLDLQFHWRPILFTSPLFIDSTSGTLQNYDRVAFENDLPRIESTCNRSTGVGCVNPPVSGSFYPFFTTRGGKGSCTWQLGRANNPGPKDTFGGSSTAEYWGFSS